MSQKLRNLTKSDYLLLTAAGDGSEKIMSQAIAAGADPNAAYADGTTSLHLVLDVGVGNSERRRTLLSCCKLLIDNGADVNVRDSDGCTPLSLAMNYYRMDIIALLFEHGANPNFQDKNGDTLLHESAERGNYKFCKILLDFGADPNIKNIEGRTPLNVCANSVCMSAFKEHASAIIAQSADMSAVESSNYEWEI